MKEPRTPEQKLILSLLERRAGGENAVQGSAVAFHVGKDLRSTRADIRDLIADGYPIASNEKKPYGYFMVQTRDEAKFYADSLKSRLIEIALRRRDFRQAADQYLTPAEQGVLI